MHELACLFFLESKSSTGKFVEDSQGGCYNREVL